MSHTIKLSQPQARPAVVVAAPGKPPPGASQSGRLEAQVEQRVRLGVQLLAAAQTHANRQKELFDQLAQQHQQMRDQLQRDFAKSLQTYDQWMATFDERFSGLLDAVNKKIDRVEDRGSATERLVASFDQRMTDRLGAMDEKIDRMQAKWSATEKQIASVVRQAQQLLDHARRLPQPPPGVDRDAKPREPRSALRQTPSPATDAQRPTHQQAPRDPARTTPPPQSATTHAAATAAPSPSPESIYTKALQEVRRQQQDPPAPSTR